MKYYIIAGERSGDLHAGNLVKAIRQYDPDANFQGFGGEYMEREGVDLVVHYRDLAFMGLVEIFTNATKISKYIKRCKEAITAYNPDVIILIDYGGFNLQIAKFGKKNGYKVYYYILPKYWAWYPKRALWLKPYVDKLFIILPFEKEFFKKFEWESNYVGNPVLDAVKSHIPDTTFMSRHSMDEKQEYIALLPGSRKQELKRIIPLMAEIVKRFPDRHFAVAKVNNLDAALYGQISILKNVSMVFEDTYNLLLNSSAAIVTSGTATLETALFRIPQVVVYRANKASYWVGKRMIKVPFISLVNLIAGREVVKELIQADATLAKISEELKRILGNSAYRREMLSGYDQIIDILDTGSASDNAASLMVNYLKGGVSA